MNCPACDIEMELLLEGIFQCLNCKKIIMAKSKDIEEEREEEALIGNMIDGEWFHQNMSLNMAYEIAESGIIINKTESSLFAGLICHSSYLKDEKYVRLSWWKNYRHAGMFKIYEKHVLNNVIIGLEKIDEDFDDIWNWQGKYGKTEIKTEEVLEKEKKLEIIKYRIIENKTCPKCAKKMDKKKSHYECQHCGEIVILEGYNQPIFNIQAMDLDLQFHGNFPINFYLPVSGLTVKWLMGEWKSIVVIYSKDNPNKKWLRFYWWVRDLSNILKFGQREMGEGTQLGWKTQRGVSSPNIYDKKSIRQLINALRKISQELKWEVKN